MEKINKKDNWKSIILYPYPYSLIYIPCNKKDLEINIESIKKHYKNEPDCLNELKPYFDAARDNYDSNGKFIWFESKTYNIFMITNHGKARNRDGILVHELVHLHARLSERIGEDFSIYNDESWAYFMETIFNKLK